MAGLPPTAEVDVVEEEDHEPPEVQLLRAVGVDIMAKQRTPLPLDLNAMRRVLPRLRGRVDSARDRQGTTALGIAAYLGRTEAMQLLLENGANIDAENVDGTSPLSMACFGKSAAAAAVLLVYGGYDAEDPHEALADAHAVGATEVVALFEAWEDGSRNELLARAQAMHEASMPALEALAEERRRLEAAKNAAHAAASSSSSGSLESSIESTERAGWLARIAELEDRCEVAEGKAAEAEARVAALEATLREREKRQSPPPPPARRSLGRSGRLFPSGRLFASGRLNLGGGAAAKPPFDKAAGRRSDPTGGAMGSASEAPQARRGRSQSLGGLSSPGGGALVSPGGGGGGGGGSPDADSRACSERAGSGAAPTLASPTSPTLTPSRQQQWQQQQQQRRSSSQRVVVEHAIDKSELRALAKQQGLPLPGSPSPMLSPGERWAALRRAKSTTAVLSSAGKRRASSAAASAAANPSPGASKGGGGGAGGGGSRRALAFDGPLGDAATGGALTAAPAPASGGPWAGFISWLVGAPHSPAAGATGLTAESPSPQRGKSGAGRSGAGPPLGAASLAIKAKRWKRRAATKDSAAAVKAQAAAAKAQAAAATSEGGSDESRPIAGMIAGPPPSADADGGKEMATYLL